MNSLKALVRNSVLTNLSWRNEIRMKKYLKMMTNSLFFQNHLRYGLVGDEIRIEASSKCQLKCPICPTATGENRRRPIGWGNLSFQNFQVFVDRYTGIRKIELSNWGEMFLNPELLEILRYGHEKGVVLTAGNGVNLNTARDDVLEALVKYQLRAMTVSIDGATNESYRQYRVGGDFDKVIQRIEKINHYKELYNSPYPKLVWQFIIFGHNEHEIAQAREMADRLNMLFFPKLNAYSVYAPVKDQDAVKKDSGLTVASREEFKQKGKRYYGMPCEQLWFSPQVNWDGKLFGCCVNGWMDFGNVFESGLTECIKGERYQYAKQMLMGVKKARKDMPCTTCPYYRRDEALMFQRGNKEQKEKEA